MIESKVMVLKLYHGRKSTTEHMDGWGSEGPAFRIDSAHWTYGSLERIFFEIEELSGFGKNASDEFWLTNLTVDDLFFYGGYFYGDFSITMIEESEAIFFDETKTLGVCK